MPLDPMKILVIDDSPADALLVRRALERGGIEVEAMRRVETAAALGDAMIETAFDVIVSDYIIPGFGGMEALAIVQASGQDVPFLMVSSQVGEATAVSAMLAGAHDFIMKDKLERLAPAVLRELAEAEVRRERQAAQGLLRMYQTQLDSLVVQRTQETQAELLQTMADKDRFFASMSHDLRTPLNAILGFTSLLRDGYCGQLNDEQKRQMDIVYESSLQLLRLITDILDLSQLQSGQMRMAPKEVDLAVRLQNVAEMVRPQCEAKGIELRLDLEECPEHAVTDPERLQQILLNLLSNAVNFTQRGSVTLAAHPAEDRRWLDIDVVDTGCGIEPEQLDKIFDEFHRAERTQSAVPGTGLGLAVSRRIASLLGGTIRVQSEVDAGSTFTLRLPLPSQSDAIQGGLAATLERE